MLLGQDIVTFTESGGLLSRGWSSWSGWKSSRVWLVNLILFICGIFVIILRSNLYTSKRTKLYPMDIALMVMFGRVK